VNEALSRELNYSLFYLLLFIFPLFEITSMIPHLHEKGYIIYKNGNKVQYILRGSGLQPGDNFQQFF
jgi:hypothetical protein